MEEIRLQREAQRRFTEGLDTKAGILLGFAGTLAALAGPATTPLAMAGSALASAAAFVAMWSFLARTRASPWIDDVYRDYAAAESAFTKSILLAAHLRGLRAAAAVIPIKWFRLRLAMGLLSSSVLLLGIEAVIQ